MTSQLEIELGERIASAIPSIERIRFVSSGTEATMSAIRVARAFTKRDLILKFEGGYHGHADSFLSEAGSGPATLGISSTPRSAGCSRSPHSQRALQRYRRRGADFQGARGGNRRRSSSNPLPRTWASFLPCPVFLKRFGVSRTRDGALLIFDEVITGFRLIYGGAQKLFGVQPDITVLGKIIGGGLPVAAYGGRRDIMDLISPLGAVYQAGTLSGNPLAMRAGLATLPRCKA